MPKNKQSISFIRNNRLLKQAWRENLLKSVIVFGSSLYSPFPKDLDIAIITKNKKFDLFLKLNSKSKSLSTFDISLIKEEEIKKGEDFHFGGHGAYLAHSLCKGVVVFGENPFKAYIDLSNKKIKHSVFERMREYVYVLRKSYFDKSLDKKFESRYEKTLKLSLYLLTDEYSFPEILRIDTEQIKCDLAKTRINLTKNKKRNIENIWSKINKLYS